MISNLILNRNQSLKQPTMAVQVSLSTILSMLAPLEGKQLDVAIEYLRGLRRVQARITKAKERLDRLASERVVEAAKESKDAKCRAEKKDGTVCGGKIHPKSKTRRYCGVHTHIEHKLSTDAPRKHIVKSGGRFRQTQIGFKSAERESKMCPSRDIENRKAEQAAKERRRADAEKQDLAQRKAEREKSTAERLDRPLISPKEPLVMDDITEDDGVWSTLSDKKKKSILDKELNEYIAQHNQRVSKQRIPTGKVPVRTYLEKDMRFWEVTVDDCVVRTRWGMIGKVGQSKREDIPRAFVPRAVELLIASKEKEGYHNRVFN